MLYTVKYKTKGSFFWKTIRKVKGDLTGTAADGLVGVRILILEDERRIEIPIESTVFQFSSERFLLIRQNMEREAGQKVPVNTNLRK